jgi:uncharacterized protein YkwD
MLCLQPPVPPPPPPPPSTETEIPALQAHNEKRALHQDTSDLTWDADLAASAQAWADGCAVWAAAAVRTKPARAATLLMAQSVATILRTHHEFGPDKRCK